MGGRRVCVTFTKLGTHYFIVYQSQENTFKTRLKNITIMASMQF